MKLTTIWSLVKDTVNESASGPIMTQSAATAYYAAFSIGPLLVLAMGLAGLVFGEEQVRHEIDRQLTSFVGHRATGLIDSMMQAQVKGGTLMASIVGAVGLVLGATGVFTQLQDGLNQVWGVTARPGNSLWLYLRDRLLSLAMLLGVGFILLVSMGLSTFVSAFTHYAGSLVAVPDWLAPTLDGVVSFIVTSLLFGLILKVLPDVQILWRHVWVGAVVTAALFTAGKFLLGLYLGHEIHASAYGAGSAFVVILLYVFYASLIVFVGAEFTKLYTARSGERVRTSKYAVPVRSGARNRGPAHKRRRVRKPGDSPVQGAEAGA